MPGTACTTPAERLVRGWLCAAFSTFLAASSHVIAGGQVAFMAVVLAVTFGGLVCVVLAGRRLSLPRVMLGVAVSQLVFHTLLNVFSARPGMPSGMSADGGGHQHTIVGALPVLPVDAAASTVEGGAWMMLSHLVAVILSVALIRDGERLWWTLLDTLGARVSTISRLIRLVPASHGLRRCPVDHTVEGLYESLHRGAASRLRGPPLHCLPFA